MGFLGCGPWRNPAEIRAEYADAASGLAVLSVRSDSYDTVAASSRIEGRPSAANPRKVEAALHPAGLNVGWNHGRAAGQHVLHLHVHVIPRHAPGGRGIQVMGEGADATPLAEVAEAIRRA